MGLFKSDEAKVRELTQKSARLQGRISKKEAKQKVKDDIKSGAKYYLGHRVDFNR